MSRLSLFSVLKNGNKLFKITVDKSEKYTSSSIFRLYSTEIEQSDQTRSLGSLQQQNALLAKVYSASTQWRRQDLLRGVAIGANLEIMSWGTHGELQGRVQQLLD